MSLRWLDKLENIRPFTEVEAWGLYRLVAIGEAIGWTLLLTGMAIQHYHLPGYKLAVPIAGQVHGMLFLAYFGILVVASSSLRWSRRRLLMALMAGVPPYGSLIFEQWVSRNRKAAKSREQFRSVAWASIVNNGHRS